MRESFEHFRTLNQEIRSWLFVKQPEPHRLQRAFIQSRKSHRPPKKLFCKWRHSTLSGTVIRYARTAMDCSNSGDGDCYGLGVRLGLYLQWAAGFLLRNYSGSWKMISTVRTTNNALYGAILLTVVITTARGTALSTDYLIVYYLTVALFYSESYNLLKKGEREGDGC